MTCLVLCDFDYVVSFVEIEYKHVGPIIPQTDYLRLPKELLMFTNVVTMPHK